MHCVVRFVAVCVMVSQLATFVTAVPVVRSDRTYYVGVESLEASHWQPPSTNPPPSSGPTTVNGRTLLLYGGVGLLPYLREANRSCDWPHCNWDWVNGGVPQAANLTAHEAAIRSKLPDAVRGYNFSEEINADYRRFDGIVMVDYEEWLLEWELADIGLAPYKEAAINYTRVKYPAINDTAVITALAQAEYESAAMDFFIFTAAVVRSMLPNAKHLGFYGYPHYIVFLDHTPTKMRAANDRLLPLWQAIGGFYPSLYLAQHTDAPWDRTFDMTMDKIAEALIECNRLQRLVAGVSDGPPPAILPFTWYRYHPGTAGAYGGKLINGHDAWLEFDFPFNTVSGANTSGVVVWGYEPTSTDMASAEQWFTANAAYFVDALPPSPPS